MTGSLRSSSSAAVTLALAVLMALAFVALVHEARAGRTAGEASSQAAYVPGPGDVELVWGMGEAPRYVPAAVDEAVRAYVPSPGDVELVWGTGEAPRYVPVR